MYIEKFINLKARFKKSYKNNNNKKMKNLTFKSKLKKNFIKGDLKKIQVLFLEKKNSTYIYILCISIITNIFY